MTSASFIFVLEISVPDAATVTAYLDLFPSAEAALADRDGLDMAEGGLCFFSQDGTPLSPVELPASRQERIEAHGRRSYSLEPGTGEGMQRIVAARMAAYPQTWLAALMPVSDAQARAKGWPDMQAMRAAVRDSVKILPPELTARLAFEAIGANRAHPR